MDIQDQKYWGRDTAIVQATILNSMAGREFEQALDQHVSWGVEILDLKDAIFGKNIVQLTEDQAANAAILIRERGLSVYCFKILSLNIYIKRSARPE